MDGLASNYSHSASAPEQDRPGALSTGGTQHDNDRSEITGIRVLPTYGEITAQTGQYLPAADPTSWHLPGARGRLDREFRLLREDTAGQIRDGCREILKAIHGAGLEAYRCQRTTTNFDFCDDVKVQHVSMHNQNGIEFTVAFKQPEPVRAMEYDQRQVWWERCKRFRPGTLVSVLDTAGVILHFVVSESTLRGAAGAASQPFADSNYFNLSSDNEWSYANVMLVESSKLSDALRWYDDAQPPRYLLDFPDLLLASFKPTLEALQQLSQSPGHHLLSLLDPDVPDSNGGPVIEPPAYAQTPEFTFNLGCLTQEGHAFQFDPSHAPTAAEISLLANLPPDQAEALLKALSSEIALIYGRPGTGKSYLARAIIRTLLYNKDSAGLGPTICVFHNDAALDRMVEQLLDDGVDGIVRMGGRSTSERLLSLDLPATSYAGMCGQERHTEKQITEFSRMLVSNMEEQLLQLSNINLPFELRRFAFLDMYDRLIGPHHRSWQRDRIIEDLERTYQEFEEIDAELPRFHDDARRKILQGAQVIAVTTTELAKSPQLLQPLQAQVLICDDANEFLESQILTAILPSIEHFILIGDHEQLLPKVRAKKFQRSSQAGGLKALDVSLFERLVNSPYRHGPNFPFSTLTTQGRMNLPIARLICPAGHTILRDASAVVESPPLAGIRSRISWFDHKFVESHESSTRDDDSCVNYFEVEMVTAMVSYIVRQGQYSSHDIAVITPSSGQLRQLLRRMETETFFTTGVDDRDLESIWEINPNEHRGLSTYTGPVFDGPQESDREAAPTESIRLTTLENFRGEEAKVVIISLVRCNSQNACGSMAVPNRINTLMSRARHGCYILGDSDTYKGVPEWDHIINMLQAEGNLGDRLELQCPRHPDEIISVSRPNDFALAFADGGCSQPCGKLLSCGHDCQSSCHSENLHEATICNQPCPRLKSGCEHICPLTCGARCEDKCGEVIEDIYLSLPCRHVLQSAKCWQVQDPSTIICEADVSHRVPGCGHEVIIPCFRTGVQDGCPARCGRALPCGHICQRNCQECNFRDENTSMDGLDTFVETTHELCDQACGRRHADCAHICQRTCHGNTDCGPCEQPCDVHCSHTRCDKLCHEPCMPCTEAHCDSGCPHGKCTMPCAAPCNWVPCSKRCTQLLGCGHQCPSLCGVACPDSKYCQTCGAEDILLSIVDTLGMKDYRDVGLDEDPCVFFSCGHFQSRSSMDQHLDMQQFFNLAEDGTPLSIKGVLRPFSIPKVACCANCRGSLRDICRYGRIIRRPLLDNPLKDFISWSDAKFLELNGRLAEEARDLNRHMDYRRLPTSSDQRILRIQLEGNMQNQIEVLRNSVGQDRYTGLAILYSEIHNYAREMEAKEEVFRKVAGLMNQSNEDNEAAHRSMRHAIHEPFVHTRGHILAMDLYLRCSITAVTDFLKLKRGTHSTGITICERTRLQGDVTSNLRCSLKLIRSAKDTDRQIFEAQGHLYFAWFCGFARAFGEDIRTRAGGSPPITAYGSVLAMSGSAATYNEFESSGLDHISKARGIHESCDLTSQHLKDEIETVECFVREGRLDGEAICEGSKDWYTAVTQNSNGTGSWIACDNGHPFKDSRSASMLLGQLQCVECGRIVADNGHVSEEDAPRFAEETSQSETLVDI